MLAPSSYGNDLVDNKKSGEIRFKKINGRIAVFNEKKKVEGSNLLLSRVKEMETEIKFAEKGESGIKATNTGFTRYSKKSTFPSWFSQAGFNSKADFSKVFKKKQGMRYERILKQANKDLSSGYKTTDGIVPENTDYLVKTRQKFDNKNVVFRRINGRIVPIKRTKQEVIPF